MARKFHETHQEQADLLNALMQVAVNGPPVFKSLPVVSLQTGSLYGLFRDLLSTGVRAGVREGEPAMVPVRFEFCLLSA